MSEKKLQSYAFDDKIANCQPIEIHTQLYSPSKAATIKKQTKQRKRSEINHCKISQTQQDNTFQYYRPDIQHTVDK